MVPLEGLFKSFETLEGWMALATLEGGRSLNPLECKRFFVPSRGVCIIWRRLNPLEG